MPCPRCLKPLSDQGTLCDACWDVWDATNHSYVALSDAIERWQARPWLYRRFVPRPTRRTAPAVARRDKRFRAYITWWAEGLLGGQTTYKRLDSRGLRFFFW